MGKLKPSAVVKSATYDNTNGHISATLNDGDKVTTTGPTPLPDQDAKLFTSKGVKFETPTAEHLGDARCRCCCPSAC